MTAFPALSVRPVMSKKPAKPHVPDPGGRPSQAQRRWLQRGLGQAGGKLPLFDAEGREVPQATIRACIEAGWAEPWFANPVKPDWLVCKLTEAGRRAIGAEPIL
jgi:hypothetical protein